MTTVLVAVEGSTDLPVAEALVRFVGCTPREVHATGGSSSIDSRLSRWCQASNREPMLILRDWDDSDAAACVPELLGKVLGGSQRAPHIALRIVVRSIESWIMADAAEARQFFGAKMPPTPDALRHPKHELLRLCMKSSKPAIRRNLVSRSGGVGVNYAGLLSSFAAERWSPARARLNSPSLDRSLARLEQLRADGTWI